MVLEFKIVVLQNELLEILMVLSLQEIHSLPTENSVGNINNSVGN